MTENTRKITFKQREDHRDATRERPRRAEAGETGAAVEQVVRSILNFEQFDDIERLVRPSNLELFKAIVTQQPESIRDPAETSTATTAKSTGISTNSNRAEHIDLSIRFPRPPDDGELPGATA